MAARKTARKPTKRKKARKGPRPSARGLLTGHRLPRISELDQSRRDALGLGLLGLAVLLAFVFYFGWDGGRVGHALSEALRFFLGAIAYLVPLLLLASGAALLAQRREAEEPRQRRLGAVILFAALMLG